MKLPWADNDKDGFEPPREWAGDDDRAGSGGRSGGSNIWYRLFENPENPMGWSIRIFAVGWGGRGITVRIHLFTIVYIGVMLAWSIPKSNAGIAYMSLAMASLFIVVLLHEFGHCFACRATGGEADRIVMLPFGGLALTSPLQAWKSHLITTLGGPAVNVAILPITTGALLALGLGDVVLFNPFDPIGTLASPVFQSSSTAVTLGLVGLWWFHYVNIVIGAFNVLLPMYPFDGGRILQSSLWARVGYRRSMGVAVNAGLVGAMALGVIGLVARETVLVAIAIFGAWACWVERKRLRGDVDIAMEASSEAGGADPMSGFGGGYDPMLEEAVDPREAKKVRDEEEEQAEVDRILAKISDSGMDSLTKRERKTLDRYSQKKRGG